MKYYIYTKVIDREGQTKTDSPDTDFIKALNYIRVNDLQEVETRIDDNNPNTATMIFSGKRKGWTIEATITEAEGIILPEVPLYDIASRIFWHNKEVAKGQEVSFIELLGYIRLHRLEIIEKERGDFEVNHVAFYSNFAGRENRRNRIEATITKIDS